MTALQVIGTISIVIGCVFALTGSVGVLRMPDFYTRLHPAGKSDTLAQGLILLGLALFAGQSLIGELGAEHGDGHAGAWIGPANVMLKLALLTGLLFLTAPTATHAIAKAARLDRHTSLPSYDDDDPSSSRVSQIIVAGDIHEKLEEVPEQVLDVREEPAGELARPPDTNAQDPAKTPGQADPAGADPGADPSSYPDGDSTDDPGGEPAEGGEPRDPEASA